MGAVEGVVVEVEGAGLTFYRDDINHNNKDSTNAHPPPAIIAEYIHTLTSLLGCVESSYLQ